MLKISRRLEGEGVEIGLVDSGAVSSVPMASIGRGRSWPQDGDELLIGDLDVPHRLVVGENGLVELGLAEKPCALVFVAAVIKQFDRSRVILVDVDDLPGDFDIPLRKDDLREGGLQVEAADAFCESRFAKPVPAAPAFWEIFPCVRNR